MIPALVSRGLLLLRLRQSPHADHPLFASPLSSPRSSTDTEYILPLSASYRKSSFDDALHPPTQRWFSIPSIPTSLVIVVLLFPLTTAAALFALSTLPISLATWPRTLADLGQLGRELSSYAQSGFVPTLHILAVLSTSALWKHAWSIPGSVLWNVLAGALFHPVLATLLMTSLTTLGSLLSTFLATPLAPILSRLFPRALQVTRAALVEGTTISTPTHESIPLPVLPENKETLSKSKSAALVLTNSQQSTSTPTTTPAWVRLSILRLIGVVPWSGINIACGLTGVRIRDCLLGAFIGTLPWTFVTCQIGDILHLVGGVSGSPLTAAGIDSAIVPPEQTRTVSSVLSSPEIIVELILLSVLSLAPVLGRQKLKQLIGSPSTSASNSATSTLTDDISEDLQDDDKRGYLRADGVVVAEYDEAVFEFSTTPSSSNGSEKDGDNGEIDDVLKIKRVAEKHFTLGAVAAASRPSRPRKRGYSTQGATRFSSWRLGGRSRSLTDRQRAAVGSKERDLGMP